MELPAGYSVRVQTIPEDERPEDHFDDPATAKQVRDDAEWKEWAWVTAMVTVACDETSIESVQYLGCCSYDSLADFKASGYYDDMVREGLREIKEQHAGMLAFLLKEKEREESCLK